MREAPAIRLEVLGDHPDTAISIRLLGDVLSSKGSAAAEQHFCAALFATR